MTRWEGESNESTYERIKCGVMEWVKRNTLRWFANKERKKIEEFMKKVYE